MLKRHCLSLMLQGLNTGSLLDLTGLNSHRLYIRTEPAHHLIGSMPRFFRKMKQQIEAIAVMLFVPKSHLYKQKVRPQLHPRFTTRNTANQ